MASTNKTANLDLNQWSLSDKPEMADFNADNLKIDTELTAHLAESVQDVGGVHGFEIEEGTWTPGFEFAVSSTGVSISSTSGEYVKQGRVVTLTCSLSLSNKGTGNGNGRLTNFPFAVSETTTNPIARFVNLNLPSGMSTMCLVVSQGQARGDLVGSGSGLGFVGINETNITNTTGFRFTFQYITQ